MLFINYISDNTPKEAIKKYRKQQLLLHTTIRRVYPESNVLLLRGREGRKRFIEALSLVKTAREKYSGSIFYLDCDCILVERFDHLFEIDFDVAVIYRYRHDKNGGPQDCLGGFLLFSGRRPNVEDRFLDGLIEKTRECYTKDKSKWFYDQIAINKFIGVPPKERIKTEYSFAFPYKPCLKTVNGVIVLYLSANEYACARMFYTPEKVYMYHYNHTVWPHLKTNST